MSDPARCDVENGANMPGNSGHGLAGAVHELATQYGAAILVAVVVLCVFFPGNEFLPVPWQHDDYNNLAGHLNYHAGHRVDLFCARPVSTNLIWCLSAAGDTAFFLVMLLLAALLPVLAVRLALRLFRCQPGPWHVLWLTVAVSFCTFLCEQSLWFYRYTGLMTNLTSLVAGMLAAYSFSRYFDGRKSAYAMGCLLFLAAAFAKEDMLVFVPLFVTVDWCIRRLDDKDRASPRQLVLVFGWLVAVTAMLFGWNAWIVHSPFTSGTDGPYKLGLAPFHVFGQMGHYAVASRTPRVMFIALTVATALGLMRRGHRVAALSLIPLTASLILPYAVLPRFIEYYCLNWLSIGLALSLVGIAVVLQPRERGRLSILPWIVPVALIVTAVLWSHSTAEFRRSCTAFLNQHQKNNRYIIQQIVGHQAEYAEAETVALLGIDDVFSPWFLCDGRYINAKLGRQVRWLLVAKPKSLVAAHMTGVWSKMGQVEVVSEQEVSAFPEITVLKFDKYLNLKVCLPTHDAAIARRTAAPHQ